MDSVDFGNDVNRTCPHGSYTPFQPLPDLDLEYLRGICACDDCVLDRQAQTEDQAPMIEACHPDDLEDDAAESLRAS